MYSVRYNCKNCGCSFMKSFQRGVEAPRTMACKNCGCFTALKVWPPELRSYGLRTVVVKRGSREPSPDESRQAWVGRWGIP